MTYLIDTSLDIIKFVLAILLCLPTLFLPYKLRAKYNLYVSIIFHFPFIIFGKITTYLLQKLNINPRDILD